MPFDGPAAASRRADREGIGNRAWAIVAGGDRLPVRPATVDAVIHTEVLCCLRPKLATLRSTRAVLRPGGRTAFSVIFPTPGLPDSQTRRAIEAGPPECGLRTTYPNLLRSAGFVDVEEHDVTPAYLATARRKLEESERFAAGMAEALGPQEFEETRAKRRLAIRAIADGLLHRSVFVARGDTAPPREAVEPQVCSVSAGDPGDNHVSAHAVAAGAASRCGSWVPSRKRRCRPRFARPRAEPSRHCHAAVQGEGLDNSLAL